MIHPSAIKVLSIFVLVLLTGCGTMPTVGAPTRIDSDQDGLTDEEELRIGTDPTAFDTDRDGLGDGEEIDLGLDPLVADGDEDGLNDFGEVMYGTDPFRADTDGDGLLDGVEIFTLLSDPLRVDTDGDGLTDGFEFEIGTSLVLVDTDGDGLTDLVDPEPLNPDNFLDEQPGSELNIDEVMAATWQVIAADPPPASTPRMIASAFAIDEHTLATNAHVVTGVATVLRSGGVAAVVQHETGARREITTVWAHPDFDGSASTSPDVGLIEVAGTLPSWLPLASDATLQDLQVLDEVILCGFPSDVFQSIDFANLEPGDLFRPRATCFIGSISSLRPFDPSVSATPGNLQLLQHDIPTTNGTSGSPILDDSGDVIAVHAAATLDEGGSNRFAVRADSLRELIHLVDSSSVAPLQTERRPEGSGSLFDIGQVLDGDWVLVGPNGIDWACMEFDRGTLVFLAPICFADSFGVLPNLLDSPSQASSDGDLVLLSYSYTIIATYDEVILGAIVDANRIDVIVTSTERARGAEPLIFSGVLERRRF